MTMRSPAFALLIVALLVSVASAAEWQNIAPNILTVAIGVSASSDDVIFVSGGADGSGAAILKSVDSGDTWENVPRDPQMMYLDIDVAKGTQAAVAGSLGFYGQVAVGSHTKDGESFGALPFVPLFSACQSVSSVSESQVYLVGFWLASIRDDPLDGVISSHDGGATLNYYPWTGESQARYGAFPGNNTWFISGGSWATSSMKRSPHGPFQLTPRIQIVRGSNGATSFKVDTEASVMGAADGYVGVIQRSLDGGKTFETIFNETGRLYFNGIDCVDEQTCWVVGEGPAGAYIFRTSNGGRTWVEQATLTGDKSLMDVQMLDHNEGWAVGAELFSNTFNALFLYTMDGGKTWTNTNTISNAYPNSIANASSGKAFATAFLRNGLSAILSYR